MKLSLKNILLWVAGLFGLLVFIFSFVTALKLTGTGLYTNRIVEIKGIIWGAKEAVNSYNGVSAAVAFKNPVGAPVAIVGAILVFVGGLCACLFSFLKLGNEVAQKVTLFGAAAFMVVGGVLMFFAQEGFIASYAKEVNMSVQEVKDYFNNFKASCALPIVSGILGLLGGGAVVASQFVKE